MERVFSNVMRGLAATLGGAVVTNLVSLLVLALLARLLLPSDFGVVASALIIIGFGNLLGQVGIGAALVQRKDITALHVGTAFTVSAVVGFSVGVGVAALSPWIADFFSEPILIEIIPPLCLMFPASTIASVSEALAQRSMEFKRLAIVRGVSHSLGFGVVAVSVALAGGGVWALVIGNVSGSVLKLLILLNRDLRLYRPGFRLTELRQLLRFGGGYSAARIANYFANESDYLIVGRVSGSAALGEYSRAYQLIQAFANLVGTVATTVLFPVFASIRDDQKMARSALISAMATVAMLAVPVSTFVIMFGPEVIAVMLGEGWENTVLPFQILACVTVFRVSSKIADSIVRAFGAVYYHTAVQLMYWALVVLGAGIGIGWGITGVATGVAAAIMINYILMLSLCYRLIGGFAQGLGARYARHCAWAVANLTLLKVVYEVTKHMESSAFVTLLFAGSALGLLYTIVFISKPGLLGKEASLPRKWLIDSWAAARGAPRG